MSLPFADRIALVTGASRGIGYAAALALARAGAHVVALARTVGGLEELDDAVRAAGGSATLVPSPNRGSNANSTSHTDDLVLHRPDFAAVPGLPYTYNQIETAHQLEGLGMAIENGPNANVRGKRGEDLFAPLFALDGPAAAQNYKMALDMLSGYQYAQTIQASFQVPMFTNDTIQTLMAMGPGRNQNWLDSASLRKSGMEVASGGQLLTDAGPQQIAQATGPSASPWTFWGRGYGVWTSLDNQTSPNNVAGFDSTRGGLIVGADYQFNDQFLLGGVVNYAHTDVDFNLNAGNTHFDTILLGLYGQYRWGQWYVNASGGGGWNSYNTTRNIAFPMFAATAHSSYNGENANLYGEVGYDFMFDNNVKLTPFGAFAWIYENLDSFTESGAGTADKSVNSSSGDSIQSILGARLSTRMQMSNGVLVPEGRIAWAHELGNQNMTVTNAFTGSPGSAFAINGAVIDRDSLLVGVGVGWELSPSTKLYLDYDGRFNSDYTQNAISAGVRLKF